MKKYLDKVKFLTELKLLLEKLLNLWNYISLHLLEQHIRPNLADP